MFWRRIFLGCFVLPLAACGLFEPAAAHQLDLTGTAWRVVRIDDDLLAEPHEGASLTFPDLDDAVLTTMCGKSTAGLALDTDGSAIVFTPFASHDCPPEVQEFESRLIDALSGLEEWRVDSKSDIRFLGRHDVFWSAFQIDCGVR